MAPNVSTKIMQHDDNGWSTASLVYSQQGADGKLEYELRFGHEAAEDVRLLFADWSCQFFLSADEFIRAYLELEECVRHGIGIELTLGKHTVPFTLNEGELSLALEPSALRLQQVHLLRDAALPEKTMLSSCIVNASELFRLFYDVQTTRLASPTTQ